MSRVLSNRLTILACLALGRAIAMVTLAVLTVAVAGQTANAQVVVTSTADIPVAGADCVTPASATCTLRAALVRVGQPAVSPRRIVFNLPGPAPHVIRVDPDLGPLDWSTGGELDGLTQLGAGRRVGSDPNNPVDYVLTVGIAAPPFETVNGPLLIMRGPGPILRGIAFFDHDGVGVRLERGSISNSFFNTQDGMNPGPRRLTKGVEYFATNAGGSNGVFSSLFMGPGIGIEVFEARPAMSQAITGLLIGESYFGTDRTGLLSRPVSYGVLAQIDTAPPVIFGAPSPVSVSVRNSLFYVAELNAIRLRGVRPGADGVSIGYDAGGARVIGAPPATQGAGILFEGPNYPNDSPSSAGGVNNVRIFGQRGPGIQLSDTSGPIREVEIIGSSLFGNGGLGISLNPAAPGTPTPNDTGDTDDGPNGRQNYPILTSIERILDANDEERIAVGLTLQSRPDRGYGLQFFANSQCHPSGHGEGELFLTSEFLENGGQVQTDASGDFSGVVTLQLDVNTALARLQGRPFVTVLATAAVIGDAEDYNTSEFSPCFDAGNLAPPGQRLGFEQTDYTFTEGQTAGLLVQRTGGTTGEMRVLVQTTDGTAEAGRDYTTVSRELVFADGIAGVGVQIPLRAENTVSEPTRELGVQLLTPTGGIGGATIDPFRAQATIRIVDDDIPPVSLLVTDSLGAANDSLMDFGAVEFNSFNEGVVTLRNTGSVTALFSTQPTFTTSSGPRLYEASNTCDLNLDGGEECEIRVRFEPGSTSAAVTGEVRIVPTTLAPMLIAVSGSAPPNANLVVSVAASPPNPESGDAVAFVVTARNLGPADAQSSEVTVTLPPELAIAVGTLAPSQGTASFDGLSQVITWLPDALSANASPPATLSFSATVTAAVGTAVTTTASVLLTDPNRVDPILSNTSDATIVVGVIAADLSIDSSDVRILRRGETAGAFVPSGTIPIMRHCTTDGGQECEDLSSERNETRWLEVTVRNVGPDAPSGPIVLRITSGFCFGFGPVGIDIANVLRWIREGAGDYSAECRQGTVYETPLEAALPEGGQWTGTQAFRAVSGPTGLETVRVEVVHGTFDPNQNNNVALSPAIQVVIPVPGRGSEGGFAFGASSDYCFIATAAYGSWLDPHVVTLREFRDRWLLTHAPGKAFVAWYYRVSPPLADWIAEREWARALVRGLLAPIVLTLGYPVTAGLLLLAALAWLRYRRRLRALVCDFAGARS